MEREITEKCCVGWELPERKRRNVHVIVVDKLQSKYDRLRKSNSRESKMREREAESGEREVDGSCTTCYCLWHSLSTFPCLPLRLFSI